MIIFSSGVFKSKASFFVVLAIFLFSCKHPTEEKTKPPPEIPVVQVIQKDVPIIEEFVGQTYGYFDIAIRTRVDGVLEGMYFKEGSRVKKNQLLYTIDPAQQQSKVAESMSGVAQAMSQIAEAETMLAKAESDVNRYRPLVEINAVAESDLDAAEAQLGAAKAQIGAANAALEAANASLDFANIQLSYTKIYAPITGVIGISEAKVGDYVGKEPNPVVLNAISRIDTILVQFSITEKEYLALAKYVSDLRKKGANLNREVSRSLQLILADGSTHGYPGKIDFTDRQIDPTTGTLLVQASFSNPDRIVRPGQFARLRIKIDEVEGALLVPQRCVTELQGQYSVFVVNAENKIESKQIKIGEKIGDYWIVSDGLEPQDKIVLEGLQKVGSGQDVNPVLTEFESQTNFNK
jgi:membrane fusion protein, multidrug efflux system